MMLDIPLQERIDLSDLVCEGRVVHKQSYEDDHGRIYTTYFLDVSRIFKGELEEGLISFDALGGVVGDRALEVCPGFELPHGSTGVIMLQSKKGLKGLQLVAVNQSWLDYDLITGEVLDRSTKLADLDSFVSIMENWIGGPSKMVRPLNSIKSSGHTEMITVSNLSPSTIAAGRGEELVITGSGFGATRGAGLVIFRDANAGPTTYRIGGLVYTAWSDTEIRVLVPENAGSGAVRIQNNVGQVLTTTQQLIIPYNINNINGQETRMVDDESDGSGGYTFVYSTNTANGGVDFTSIPAAVAAVERAVNTWTAGTSWGAYGEEECGTTSAQTPIRDGENMITFDNDLYTLGRGVLGQMFSYLSRCGGQWEITEVDMILKRNGTGVNWEYGPAAPSGGEIDFESVVLHEFGHAHGLGHTAVSSAVMFRSISAGTFNRNLRPEETSGGGYMQTESLQYNARCEGDYTGFDPGEMCSLILPLDLTSFRAEGMEGKASIFWTSQNEIDHRVYVLECLVDDRWEPISTQGARGNGLPGSYDYEYTHEGLSKGYYTYRLRMESISGSIEYSHLVSCEVDGHRSMDWKLRDRSLVILKDEDSQVTVDLIDLNGRVVKSVEFRAGQRQGDVSVEALNRGTYFLRLRSSTEEFRVVKMVL
jgi:hypothetical protein